MIANRASNSADAYVRVDDGYEVESDPRASMYDVYGDLKPVHVKLLKLIEKVADEEKGLTIKVLSPFFLFLFLRFCTKARKLGSRDVKPCIVGFRFIDWAIREKQAANRLDAVALGRELIRKGYLFRSDGKTSATHKSKRGRELAEFVDDGVFYYFPVAERPKLFKALEEEVRERLQ